MTDERCYLDASVTCLFDFTLPPFAQDQEFYFEGRNTIFVLTQFEFTTYYYLCKIHPEMRGSFKKLPECQRVGNLPLVCLPSRPSVAPPKSSYIRTRLRPLCVQKIRRRNTSRAKEYF